MDRLGHLISLTIGFCMAAILSLFGLAFGGGGLLATGLLFTTPSLEAAFMAPLFLLLGALSFSAALKAWREMAGTSRDRPAFPTLAKWVGRSDRSNDQEIEQGIDVGDIGRLDLGRLTGAAWLLLSATFAVAGIGMWVSYEYFSHMALPGADGPPRFVMKIIGGAPACTTWLAGRWVMKAKGWRMFRNGDPHMPD